MTILTFAMHLRRMETLTKVLMLCQRLGGKITYLSAAEGRATIVLSAPRAAAHRFAPQIRRVIDVLELTELHTLGDVGSPDSEGALLRHTG